MPVPTHTRRQHEWQLKQVEYWRHQIGPKKEELQFEVALAAMEGFPDTLLAKAARVARSTVHGWQRRYSGDIALYLVPEVGCLTENQINELERGLNETGDLRQLILAATPDRLRIMHRRRLDPIAVLADELEMLQRQLQEEVVIGAADGVPRVQLAEAAGVARSTVYDWQRRYSGQVLVRVSKEIAWITDNHISRMHARLVSDGMARLLLHSLGDEFLADLDPKRIRRAVVEFHFSGYKPKRLRMPSWPTGRAG